MDVKEDPRFARDGADLIHAVAITFSQAGLGAEIDDRGESRPAVARSGRG